MTIYYNKYGGIIHGNPDEYFKSGGKVYIEKYGHFKLKNHIKKLKKEIFESKNKYIIDKVNLPELQQYNKDMKLGYSYYNNNIKYRLS